MLLLFSLFLEKFEVLGLHAAPVLYCRARRLSYLERSMRHPVLGRDAQTVLARIVEMHRNTLRATGRPPPVQAVCRRMPLREARHGIAAVHRNGILIARRHGMAHIVLCGTLHCFRARMFRTSHLAPHRRNIAGAYPARSRHIRADHQDRYYAKQQLVSHLFISRRNIPLITQVVPPWNNASTRICKSTKNSSPAQIPPIGFAHSSLSL